jgi:ATP-binding cassette subfamily C (CFTR/MRP) protein 1
MGGLTAAVSEGGSNFSQGQRQMMCMARALLRKPKLLLMDEATSSVDVETDRLLQSVVKTQLADATVITIAHRLNTVVDSDVILVMAAGKLVEQGPPQKLLKIRGGYFAKMYEDMRASGEAH